MTSEAAPHGVSGYVLAGGRSSRMGRDKALLELQGKPLVSYAVTKLKRLCAEVAILSANPALARFAPLVADLHPGCGPLGGIEAALAHTAWDWCLILPVDVPFLPVVMLDCWVRETLAQAARNGTRLAMYVVDGTSHPALLMIHRNLAASLSASLARGEYKLLPALTYAAKEFATKHGLAVEQVFQRRAFDADSYDRERGREGWNDADPAAKLYFANLNTPDDFARAERYADALDL